MRKMSIAHVNQLRQVVQSTRRTRKLSQEGLAARLGVSQNRLSEFEIGKGLLPIDRIIELLKILELELVVQDRQPTPLIDY